MKALLNRVIDAASLIAFTAMVSTGMILKWILPPGSGHAGAVGRSGRGREVVLLLGLDRHDWGAIHFYVSVATVALLGVHLALHWNWIVATAWGTPRSPQPPLRRAITAGIVLFVLAALILPWAAVKSVR